jgi:hypothetical protein
MSEYHTLRPGLLVSMQTSIKGNTHYQTQEIEYQHETGDGGLRARWETTKTIADKAEHEEAIKQRTKIRGLILSVCSQSAFGLLCPNNREAELREAIAMARKLTDEFNSTAQVSRMSVNVIFGRIAQDDVEAIRAISGEIRSLMEDMQQGVKALDVKAIRAAANKATEVGKMLTPEANARMAVAIDAARVSARKIAKAGDVAAVEIDKATIRKIDMARTAFLDINIGDDVGFAEPKQEGRNIDL